MTFTFTLHYVHNYVVTRSQAAGSDVMWHKTSDVSTCYTAVVKQDGFYDCRTYVCIYDSYVA